MSTMSNLLLNSDATKFVVKHMLLGLVKATGHRACLSKGKARNTQCVRLNKHHANLTQTVTYWCNLRINKLEQLGAEKKVIDKMILDDARFLVSLSAAIAEQTEKDRQYDAWLFFNEDVENTDFFELQHCVRGTKITKSLSIIQANC